jgi:protein-tyrosine phosphatase
MKLFNWFKKEKPVGAVSLEWLGCDMHSHLVPGVDDGAQDLDTALDLVRGFVRLGYKKLITTPHILWELYQNTPDTIGAGMNVLREAVHAEGLPIELHAAAEYFVDDHFAGEVAGTAPLLTLNKDLVLVEASAMAFHGDFKQIIFDLQLKGYTPVIAHPERYILLKKDPSFFDDLRYNGCLFQLNLMSLVGHYGVLSKDLAELFIKKGFYDFVGTDLHHAQHFPVIERAAASPLLLQLRDSGCLRNGEL